MSEATRRTARPSPPDPVRPSPPGPRHPADRDQDLVVGVGASRGVDADEVLGLIKDTLRGSGLRARDVAALATLDTRASEPGIVGAAASLGVVVRTYTAAELAVVRVPNPSDAARGAVGTPSVAEAAALAGGGELIVPKRKSCPGGGVPMATCAVARRMPGGQPLSGHPVELPRQTYFPAADDAYHHHHHGSHAHTI